LLVVLVAGMALGAGASATTRIVVKIPEILVLRINGEAGGRVPVKVVHGRPSPESLHIEVIANTGWRLTVRATSLEGPLVLPPWRVRLGEMRLSGLEQTVRVGRGVRVFDLPLAVELFPGEPDGEYRMLLTFELYKL